MRVFLLSVAVVLLVVLVSLGGAVIADGGPDPPEIPEVTEQYRCCVDYRKDDSTLLGGGDCWCSNGGCYPDNINFLPCQGEHRENFDPGGCEDWEEKYCGYDWKTVRVYNGGWYCVNNNPPDCTVDGDCECVWTRYDNDYEEKQGAQCKWDVCFEE